MLGSLVREKYLDFYSFLSDISIFTAKSLQGNLEFFLIANLRLQIMIFRIFLSVSCYMFFLEA